MKRAQRIERSKAKAAPKIIDSRQPKEIPQPSQQMAPEVVHIPLRTVMMVEVKDMSPAHVQLLMQEINEVWKDNKGGPHYVLPVRGGRIGTDIVFEAEFLKIVHQTCEVKDGQIVLKEGAQECQIVRQQI